MTHSAISQHIKTLEGMVGVKLFIRHGRGIQINEEGRLYALQIREALNHISDATRLVQVKPRATELTLANAASAPEQLPSSIVAMGINVTLRQ